MLDKPILEDALQSTLKTDKVIKKKKKKSGETITCGGNWGNMTKYNEQKQTLGKKLVKYE